MENPYLTIFQELFILIGTTYADGCLTQYFKPVCANAFGFPVLLLVPSGKITAERFLCTPNPLIAGIACFESLRSINAEPP
jgi:hypothetical protein